MTHGAGKWIWAPQTMAHWVEYKTSITKLNRQD